MRKTSTELAPFRQPSVRDLIERRAIVTVLEPIVDTESYRFHGHEALSRGALSGLPTCPEELFDLAEEEGLAVQLAELMRERAVQVVGESYTQRLFLTSHPAEYGSMARLLASLSQLRERYPELLLVLEVPEKAGVAPGQLRWLRQELSYLAVEIAYKAFSGDSVRVDLLAAVPPDYLKIDEELLARAYQTNFRILLTGIIDIVHELGVRALAEGLVLLDEVVSCRHLRFDLCQGPAPLFFPTHGKPLEIPASAGRSPRRELEAKPATGPSPRVLGPADQQALEATALRFAGAAAG